MKQNLTFEVSTIASTQSQINVDAFDRSMEAFEKKQYTESFLTLLDYIDPDLRQKFGTAAEDEFHIPHGSIIVNISLKNNRLDISAPFLALPEKNRVPLLRQVASLNINNLDLTRIVLREDKLYFEYGCPLDMVNPYKIYYILNEICQTGDQYDDEFSTKFGAQRIYEPKITPYDAATIDRVYDVIQLSCRECLDAVKYFESERKYSYAWNILASTMLKVLYFAHPQGQLLNDLDKAVKEHDREDIPLPEIVARGKETVAWMQGLSKEDLAKDLYFVETFVPGKRRSNLKNIQENFKNTYTNATSALESGDYMACCVMIVYKFYEMYYYNDVQDDVNAVVVRAMKAASAKPWEEAAPILQDALDDIMEGELDLLPEDGEEEEVDMSAYMQNMQAFQQQALAMQQQAMANAQQAMQGIDMEEYMKNIQKMMSSMMGGAAGNDNTDKE